MLLNPVQWIACLGKKGIQKESSVLYKTISLLFLILVSFWHFTPIMINKQFFSPTGRIKKSLF